MAGNIGSTTHSFGEGKALSSDLRGTTPEHIAEITARLQHIKETSKDWITPSGCLTALPTNGEVKIKLDHPNGDKALFGIQNIAHEQFASKLGIPMVYYRRMLAEAPGLLANNLNYWLVNQAQNLRLRTLDGNIRAALSERYRSLDSFDFMLNVFDEGKKAGAVTQRLDLSESRFYLRLVADDFRAKITGRGKDIMEQGKGLFSTGYKRDNGTWQGPDSDDPNSDWCFPTIIASNSDVGRGGLNVEFGALRTTCSNLILVGIGLHKVHIGEVLEQGLVNLSDETRTVKDQALWLEVRDVVRAAFDEAQFKEVMAKFNNSQSQELANPVEAVDGIVQAFGFSEEDKDSILNELISPSFAVKPGATVWGLAQAVTALQHREGTVDNDYELARIGGKIIQNAKELVAIR